MRTKLVLALLTPLAVVAMAAPVSANPPAAKPGKTSTLKCFASDPADVVVNSDTNTVTITDDPTTGGNNFGCTTNIVVTAGDTITFNHDTTCGGGVPRVFVRFTGSTGGENTFDTGTCTDRTDTSLGTVTYTLMNSGKIRTFAFINDRGDSGTVTYSNLVIAGNVIDF